MGNALDFRWMFGADKIARDDSWHVGWLNLDPETGSLWLVGLSDYGWH